MRVAPLRTMVTLLLAIAMVAGIPSAAAVDTGSSCESFHASSVPVLHPQVDVGEIVLCDDDGDGAFDTAAFHTRYVETEGEASLTDETKQRADHQDREIEADARLSTGGPARPAVEQSVTADDDGNDGQIDRVDHEGAAETRLTRSSYLVTGLDDDGDGLPDGYGLTVCSTFVGCERPGPRAVPEVPDRVDLPDTVVYIPPVGYIP